ncbi:DUF1934 domain-containing protein [bacterium 210820-DFI.6.37]|nr:DUF1934 domain-containing protein [bacterium 210820-DFI.6.37]
MKNIMMKIIGTQVTADLEEDQMEFITEGKLYQKGDALYLIYDETEISGMPGCRTRLKLKNGTVKMKRIGENVGIDTEIEFEQGKRYNGYYDTPFGAIEMEVLTNHIENSLTPEGTGTVDIDYHISLKGLVEGRNRLNIQLM